MNSVATTPTPKPIEVEHDTQQSVYIADQDKVKLYPRSMSNDEIDFDLHTSVRKQTPEDYYVNFKPLITIQQGFKEIVQGPLGSVVEAGAKSGKKATEEAVKFQDETITPAFKYAITGDLEQSYKPWLDIWRESVVGKKATGVSDVFLSHAPAPIAAIPWFVAEFVPEQLLEFGTKPLNWVGAYGVEKFGPPIINKLIQSKFNKEGTAFFSKLFKGEMDLKADFEVLGLSPNAKTSEVVNAHKNAAKWAHPDAGGAPDGSEFNKVQTAYEKIMKSRGISMDKFFDMFRESPLSKPPKEKIAGLLGNQKGSANLIPFSDGDLVKIGEKVGQIVNISGQIATVNIAGKQTQVPFDQMTVLPKKGSAVNKEYMAIPNKSRENLEEASTLLGKELTNQGKPLKHEEVVEKAKEAELITQGVSREATLNFQASLLKTRQHLAALADQNELTAEFLDTLKIVANTGTDIARNLESLKLYAMPEYAETKIKIIKDLQKLGIASEDILKAAKGVDFKDEQQVAKFYRTFVKPKLPEMLDEFVYMNILSSPVTHIKNTFSNLLQLAGVNPLTKLASGSVDFVASKLTGKEREHYVSEIPDFYKGALNALPKAMKGAADAMAGKKNIERPDVKHLPTLSKLVDYGTLKVGKYVTRALEASDVFFRTLIESGEVQAMSKKAKNPQDEKTMSKIQTEAQKRATYYVFRNKPDSDNASGQGDLLSAIDQMTNAIYRLRSVPGMKWFVRFVQTPMNILKQGIEYSPAGFATMKGAKDKSEQAGKAIVGSIVFAGASWLAANNLTTWASPKGAKEKNEFYAAGLQPYSVRIGDKWVSYSQIGPLAYPLAMASALHYFTKESPNALSDSEMDKVVDALTGIMRFFSDQSYMQGLSDLVGFVSGEKSKAVSSVPSQLVPLSSLQGWVNNLIDPLQRKAEKGLSIESVLDNLQMKIIGMSKFVPPQIDEEEVPVKKKMQAVNAVSPVRVSKVNRGKLAEYKESQEMTRLENKDKKDNE